jgi:hypothetical protein
MPRGIPGSGPTAKVNKLKRFYFLVSGEIEYSEAEGVPSKYMKVNGIHVDTDQRLNVKALATIQTTLQMHFHTKYSKTHPSAPQITDAVINSITYLGLFTQDEFHKGAPADLAEPEEKKKIEIQVTPGKDPVLAVVPDAPITKVEEAAKPVETPVVTELPKPVEPVVTEIIALPVAETLKTP